LKSEFWRTSISVGEKRRLGFRPPVNRVTAPTDWRVMEASEADLGQIQGNLSGFNKDHQRFLFLKFPDQASGKAFLAAVVDEIATCAEVRAFNDVYRQVSQRRHDSGPMPVEATWINLAISYRGLEILGAADLDRLPDEFKVPMRDRAEIIGDKDNSAPTTWAPPFQDEIHAMLVIASDDPNDLEEETTHLREHLSATGVAELAALDGNDRPDPNRGREHFGFKDGISQPTVSGVTSPARPGEDEIPLGEFVLGQPGLEQAAPPAAPADAYNPVQPTPPPEIPEWARNGSFVVFRKLFQDVAGFTDFVTREAANAQMTEDLLGAKLVGRYKSGAPLQRTAGTQEFDPQSPEAAADSNPSLNSEEINNFDYSSDPDGFDMPRSAHIRKSNPRASNPPGQDETNHHRILRRGIQYGPDFQTGETPYGGGVPNDGQDRGLLFVCYQSSIARGFEFIQTQWMNQDNFPLAGDGRDPIVSQDIEGAQFNLPRKDQESIHLTLARWVITRGGEYFLSPSIDGVRALSQG